MDGILTAVERLGLESELRDQLATILSQNQPVAELQQQYQKFVGRYLAVKQPFHWNSSAHGTPDAEKDIDQYLELVEFCAFVENTELLEQWGLNILEYWGGNRTLAESPNYYVRAFKFVMDDSPDTIKPYLKWLIEVFKQLG